MKYTNNYNFTAFNSSSLTGDKLKAIITLSKGAIKFMNETLFFDLMNNFVKYVITNSNILGNQKFPFFIIE